VAAAHQVGVFPPDRPRSLSDDSAAAANAAGFKARFYTIARGSAMESLALIEVLVARPIATIDAAKDAMDLGGRVVQMLTKLQQAMVG
jgi:hypothetical protein